MKVIEKAIHTLQNEGIASFFNKTRRKAVHIYQEATFKPYIITKTITGETFQILISNLFAKSWYDRSHEWPELAWVKENLLVEGDIVADCGANNGFTGLFFSKCVGSTGKVVGFEGLSTNVEVANENIRLNHIKNLEIINVAVGSHQGFTKFLDHPNGSVGEREDMKVIEVPMLSLDDFFKAEKPTFLKIDVEGHEIEVLKGAKEIIKTHPKFDIEIHCSYFENRLSFVAELLNLLPLSEYQIYLQLVVDSPIVPHILNENTPELIAKYDNVHLFIAPK